MSGLATTERAEEVRSSTVFDLRKLAARQAMPVAVIALIGWLLWDRLGEIDLAHVKAALATVSPTQWLLGAFFSGLSFWALGRYDAVVHRMLGTGITGGDAVRSGMTAIAVSQTLGMGAVTGSFVRWRMLPSLSLVEALRVSAVVALSFLAGWAVLAAAAVMLVELPLPGARPIAALVLTLAALVAGLTVLRPGPLARMRLPTLRAMGTILGLAALDTMAAGTVLWVLLPNELVIAPATLIAAYLLALGAGIVLTTPGGVGPFEVALIALLPGLPQEPVLAAIIAYRVLYYALPAVIGLVVLARGALQDREPALRASLSAPAETPSLPFVLDAMIEGAPRAEAALLRHGRVGLLRDRLGRPAALAHATGQSLIALSDPLSRDTSTAAFLEAIDDLARDRFLAPVLYKTGGRMAAAARRAGWAVLPIAREAWIPLDHYSTKGSSRSGLRRKLRKAETAGLTVTEVSPTSPLPLPLAEMEEIARGWAVARGGERGFSMGTWLPEALPWARVYLARDAEGVLLGFITVHANAREHTLDLIRPAEDAPDGTTYLMVNAAIEAAQRDGAERFSLAAVPMGKLDHERPIFHHLREALDKASGAGGLRQFKATFSPKWETLYLAAPSRHELALGAWDVMREISRPVRRMLD